MGDQDNGSTGRPFLLGYNCPVSLGIVVQEQGPSKCLGPKKSRRELFQRIFVLGIFWGGVIRYAATPLTVALSPGHSDITRFRPWSPIVTGNHLDRAEKNPNLLRQLAPLTF